MPTRINRNQSGEGQHGESPDRSASELKGETVAAKFVVAMKRVNTRGAKVPYCTFSVLALAENGGIRNSQSDPLSSLTGEIGEALPLSCTRFRSPKDYRCSLAGSGLKVPQDSWWRGYRD